MAEFYRGRGKDANEVAERVAEVVMRLGLKCHAKANMEAIASGSLDAPRWTIQCTICGRAIATITVEPGVG